METLLSRHWHHMTADDAASLLASSAVKGLHPLEAKDRLEHFGPNVITTKKKRNPLLLLLLQFHQPLVYILIAAGTVTALLGEPVDSAVIVGVVLLNAVIGFVQELKAERAIESLRGLITTETTVVRDGAQSRVPSRDLVPGDLVVVQSGDKVPADLLLVSVRELQVDESALTGESVPAGKEAGPLPASTTLPERRNMAYAGTLATYGQATGLVIATGDGTETGRISDMIA
ncbi:MAG TPA: HAD-IC family P-type ATPase, partial [Spirochaetota bacterium]|nr:HAD-IC family P-type ATPase [Spirochaetota bacterium]